MNTNNEINIPNIPNKIIGKMKFILEVEIEGYPALAVREDAHRMKKELGEIPGVKKVTMVW